MSIYTTLKSPTRLYIKKLNNIYYFGKSIKKNLHTYHGSGKRWTNHLKKYGKNNVETLWISDWYYDTSIIDIALHFSQENDIVNSDKWANLIPENGINGGGDCSQMHNKEAWTKAANTYKNKPQHEKDAIRKRMKETIFKKYGVNLPGQLLTNENSIIKRNKTNIEKYGSACPANKNGNNNSKEKQQYLLNRLIVKQLKCLSVLKRTKFNKGWCYKSENELEILFSETLKIQNNTGSKIYNKSQTKRTDFLARKSVLILMSINRIHPLKLSNNWFQKDDLLIEQILIEVKKTYPSEYDIALQIIDQYY